LFKTFFILEVESDDDYWSSTCSEEEDETIAAKQQLPQQQRSQQQFEPSSPVIRNNNQLSKLKRLTRKKLLRSPRKIKNFEDQEVRTAIVLFVC
jgi:FtsZ-interacting cell division protein YlmF